MGLIIPTKSGVLAVSKQWFKEAALVIGILEKVKKVFIKSTVMF